jgi:hypothetical protein
MNGHLEALKTIRTSFPLYKNAFALLIRQTVRGGLRNLSPHLEHWLQSALMAAIYRAGVAEAAVAPVRCNQQ